MPRRRKDHRIARRRLIEIRVQHAPADERPRHPDRQADPTSVRPCLTTIGNTAVAAGAERHAHAEFLRALRHRRRDDAADAGDRDEQRERREDVSSSAVSFGVARNSARRVVERLHVLRPACSDRCACTASRISCATVERVAGRSGPAPPGEPLPRSASAACRPAATAACVEAELPHVADDADDGRPASRRCRDDIRDADRIAASSQ